MRVHEEKLSFNSWVYFASHRASRCKKYTNGSVNVSPACSCIFPRECFSPLCWNILVFASPVSAEASDPLGPRTSESRSEKPPIDISERPRREPRVPTWCATSCRARESESVRTGYLSRGWGPHRPGRQDTSPTVLPSLREGAQCLLRRQLWTQRNGNNAGRNSHRFPASLTRGRRDPRLPKLIIGFPGASRDPRLPKCTVDGPRTPIWKTRAEFRGTWDRTARARVLSMWPTTTHSEPSRSWERTCVTHRPLPLPPRSRIAFLCKMLN